MENKIKPKGKRAQEEMVGFAAIIVIVSVIVLVFLGFSLRQKNSDITGSYEMESFLQALLQKTTEHDGSINTVREDIKDCEKYELNCDELENELKNILEESWNVDEDGKIKGYLLRIYQEDKEIIVIREGNQTKTYKGSSQVLADEAIISLSVYY